MRMLIACFALSTFAGSSHAEIITVDDDDPAADFATIQEAVDVAVDGDRIEVGPGYYFANSKAAVPVVKVFGKSIEIVAITIDPAATVIAGQGLRRCVEWENAPGDCKLVGFTLDSGFTNNDGAGLLIDGAALEIEDCVFQNCSAGGDGGAISSHSETIYPPLARNCRFLFNSATSDGGAISAVGGVDLYSCVFENNTAVIFGGGIALDGNPAGAVNYSIIKDCDLRDCSAEYGGGTYGHEATLRVTDSRFSECIAGDDFAKTGSGGGIAIALGRLEMSGGWISGCEGGESSGALDVDQSTAECSGVSFNGNTGWDFAAGVYAFGELSSLTFDECSFSDNYAPIGNGGAILCNSTVTSLVLNGCTFDNNFAFGTTCVSAPNVVTATACEFNAQEPIINIGVGSPKVWLSGVGTGSRFTDCRFVDGESIDLASAFRATNIGGLEFLSCLFQGNETISVRDFGEGAVYIDADRDTADPIRFEGCEFRNNGACCLGDGFFAGVGGAVRVVGRTAEVSFCIFGNNSAFEGGSLFGKFHLSNCDLFGLSSIGYGGAAYLLEGSSLVECRISGSADCNYPWIYAVGPITIDSCTMSGGHPEGFECFVDPAELAGCRLVAGTTVRNTRFCNYDPAAIFGEWTDLGGNSFNPKECNAADINGDGVVNGADLTMILGSWGHPCLGCPADVNDDGEVNGADLAIVLGAWS